MNSNYSFVYRPISPKDIPKKNKTSSAEKNKNLDMPLLSNQILVKNC